MSHPSCIVTIKCQASHFIIVKQITLWYGAKRGKYSLFSKAEQDRTWWGPRCVSWYRQSVCPSVVSRQCDREIYRVVSTLNTEHCWHSALLWPHCCQTATRLISPVSVWQNSARQWGMNKLIGTGPDNYEYVCFIAIYYIGNNRCNPAPTATFLLRFLSAMLAGTVILEDAEWIK